MTETAEQTTSTEPWYKPYVKGEGDDKILGRYKTQEEALASIPEMRRTISGSMRLPDATKLQGDDLVKAHRDVLGKIGLPDAPEGYDFKDLRSSLSQEVLDSLPGGADAFFLEAAKKAHGYGMLPWQAKIVLSEALAKHAEAIQAQGTAAKESETLLKTAWGTKYDENLATSKAAIARLQDEATKAGDKSAAEELAGLSPRAAFYLHDRLYKDGAGSPIVGSGGAPDVTSTVTAQVRQEYPGASEDQIKEIVDSRIKEGRA